MAEPLSREERERLLSSWSRSALVAACLTNADCLQRAEAALREYLELGEGCTCSACSLARAYFVQADGGYSVAGEGDE